MNTGIADPGHDGTADERLAAALTAVREGDDPRAMQLLREALAGQPVFPLAHFLLAGLLAHEKAYGDALLHYAQAVEQAPGFSIARLQLGLLWLTQQMPSNAANTLRPLHDLPESDPIRHFGLGLSAVAEDRVADALAHLGAGLQLPCDNEALVADMRRLQGDLQALAAQATPAAPADAAERGAEGVAVSADMAIQAYTGRNDLH